LGVLIKGIFEIIFSFARLFSGPDPWVGVAILLAILALLPLILAVRWAWRRWRGGRQE
jgi:hypothetical protein